MGVVPYSPMMDVVIHCFAVELPGLAGCKSLSFPGVSNEGHIGVTFPDTLSRPPGLRKVLSAPNWGLLSSHLPARMQYSQRSCLLTMRCHEQLGYIDQFLPHQSGMRRPARRCGCSTYPEHSFRYLRDTYNKESLAEHTTTEHLPRDRVLLRSWRCIRNGST